MEKLNIIYKSPTDLIPYTNNPRVHGVALSKIRADIEEFGFVAPVLVSGVDIVDGHARHKVALEMGLNEIPTVNIDHLTPDQLRALRLVMNKSAEWATWDEKKLFEELAAIEIDMSTFGFDMEIEELIVAEDDGYDCETSIEACAKSGELYQLGKHILLCGDSTQKDDVLRLMGGNIADMLLTDPPYNVNYVGKNAKKMTMHNDNTANVVYKELMKKALCCADTAMRTGAAFYIWHADTEETTIREACIGAGLEVKQSLIWCKNTATFGWQDYKWQHEPCLYGWKGGSAHYFCDDRRQTTILMEKKPNSNDLHPTMKPIPLMARLIQNSTKKGESVLDLFGGSGTTMIAAEQTGRSCFTMEINPHFVDVIINRWEVLTSEKAKKIV